MRGFSRHHQGPYSSAKLILTLSSNSSCTIHTECGGMDWQCNTVIVDSNAQSAPTGVQKGRSIFVDMSREYVSCVISTTSLVFDYPGFPCWHQSTQQIHRTAEDNKYYITFNWWLSSLSCLFKFLWRSGSVTNIVRSYCARSWACIDYHAACPRTGGCCQNQFWGQRPVSIMQPFDHNRGKRSPAHNL